MILHRRRAAKRDRLSRTISDTYRSQSQGAPMNREDAWNILCEHTKTEPLRKHALAVDAAVRKKRRGKGSPRTVTRGDSTSGAGQVGATLASHSALVIGSRRPGASRLGIAGRGNSG